MGRKPSTLKRQTRLTFQPVPEGHEALATTHPSVRPRAAFVGYEGSPVKRRRVDAGHDTFKQSESPSHNGNKSSEMDRPAPTSSPASRHESAEPSASPAVIPRRSRRGKPAQPLSPARHTQESPSASQPMPWNRILPGRRARESRAGLFGADGPMIKSSWKQRVVLDESEEEEEEGGDGDDQRAEPTTDEDDEEEDDDEEPRRVSPVKGRGGGKRGVKRRLSSEDEGERDDDGDLPSASGVRSGKDGGEGSSEEDDMPVPSSAVKRRRLASTRPSRRKAESESEDAMEEEEDEEDEDVPRSTRKQGVTTTDQSKRRQEEEDLAEDLEFLESSPPPRGSQGRGGRSSQATPKKNKKLSALEELRRRRQGNAGPSSSLPVHEEEDEEDEDFAEPVEIGYDDGAGMDEDVDDFVVEDDPNDPIGVPDIPLEFTRLGTAKAKDLFRYAVAWMVHKKLNPRFNMDEAIYHLAFRKLSDEVKGLAGSKFTSSVWTRDFTRALHARPGIIEDHVGTEAWEHCQACNRKTHPATWTIRFEGKPYDPATLDELYMTTSNGSSDESDDSDDDDSGEETRKPRALDRDVDGNALPPESRLFYVGVHCKANATTAHTLTHWKIHLYEWVVDHLAQLGHLDPAEIVRRDGWSDRRKEKFAARVAKAMVTDGEVKRLYRDFQHNVNDARNAKQQYGRWGY